MSSLSGIARKGNRVIDTVVALDSQHVRQCNMGHTRAHIILSANGDLWARTCGQWSFTHTIGARLSAMRQMTCEG